MQGYRSASYGAPVWLGVGCWIAHGVWRARCRAKYQARKHGTIALHGRSRERPSVNAKVASAKRIFTDHLSADRIAGHASTVSMTRNAPNVSMIAPLPSSPTKGIMMLRHLSPVVSNETSPCNHALIWTLGLSRAF